jgi:hypothetical protein
MTTAIKSKKEQIKVLSYLSSKLHLATVQKRKKHHCERTEYYNSSKCQKTVAVQKSEVATDQKREWQEGSELISFNVSAAMTSSSLVGMTITSGEAFSLLIT